MALLGQTLGKLIPLRAFDFVLASGRALRVGAALVGFVDDDEVPPFVPYALADIVLLRVVDGCDDLALPLPEVQELLLVVGRVDDLKRLVEEAQHLVLPLNGQGRGDQDEAAVDGLPQLELLDQQAGHDRLAGTGVVGEQEPQPRLRQHLQVDRFDLVREGADAGQADRELAVVGVGEANAGGLHEEPQPVRVRGPRRFLLCRRFRPEDRRRLVGRDHRLLDRAVGQANTALEPGGSVRAQRSHVVQDDGHVEVPGEGHPAPDLR